MNKSREFALAVALTVGATSVAQAGTILIGRPQVFLGWNT